MECPQARWHQAPCLAQDPHPLPGRRMAHSPRAGIDAQTLEIRTAELTTSDVSDAPIPVTEAVGWVRPRKRGDPTVTRFVQQSHCTSLCRNDA